MANKTSRVHLCSQGSLSHPGVGGQVALPQGQKLGHSSQCCCVRRMRTTALPPWYFLLDCDYVRLTENKKRATCGHAWIELKKKRKKEKLLWKPLECKTL